MPQVRECLVGELLSLIFVGAFALRVASLVGPRALGSILLGTLNGGFCGAFSHLIMLLHTHELSRQLGLLDRIGSNEFLVVLILQLSLPFLDLFCGITVLMPIQVIATAELHLRLLHGRV